MEKINELLALLVDPPSAKIQGKIAWLEGLTPKLALATEEYEKDKSDENQQAITEITDYQKELTEEIIGKLQKAIDKKNAPPAKPAAPGAAGEKKEGIGVLGFIGIAVCTLAFAAVGMSYVKNR